MTIQQLNEKRRELAMLFFVFLVFIGVIFGIANLIDGRIAAVLIGIGWFGVLFGAGSGE